MIREEAYADDEPAGFIIGEYQDNKVWVNLFRN